MSKRNNFGLGRRKGMARGELDRLATVNGPAPGMVLTKTGVDVPLDPSATIDLVAEKELAGGQTPSFTTRQADPMRAFAQPPDKIKTFIQGGEVRSIPVSEEVQTRLDKLRMSGEDDSDLLRRIMSDAEKPGTAIPASMVPGNFDPSTIPFPASERTAADGLKIAMDKFRPDQRSRIADALQRKGLEIDMVGSNVTLEIRPREDHQQEVIAEFLKMAAAPVLQKLGESAFHKCIEAWSSGAIIASAYKELPADLQRDTATYWFEAAQVIVVQHDLAAAFKNSAEFSGGSWHLPYLRTVFEFRISGPRCALALVICPEDDLSIKDMRPNTGIFNVETSVGWALGGMIKFSEDGTIIHRLSDVANFVTLQPVVEMAVNQARAICICLEAEVAETEIVRAPHKLNAKRERAGKLPLFDYHVVDLAHRRRYAARLPDPGDIEVEYARRRLHWVRAHIRHYPNHKVPIKWHLRGDPDLGFVDKEYRL